MRTEIVLILLLITTIVSGRRTHHHTKDVHRFSIDTEEGRRELINYYNEDVEAVSKKKDSGSRLPANRSNGSGNKKPIRPNKRPNKKPNKKGPNKKKPRPNRS